MPGDPYSSIVGGVIGGTAGAIGGYLEARQRGKQIRHLRKRIQAGVDIGVGETARSVANTMSSAEYLTGANFIRSMFGLGDSAPETRGKLQGEFGLGVTGPWVEDTLHNNMDNPNMRVGHQNFMGQDAMGNPLDILGLDFVKSLRAAQSVRGIEPSAAAGAAEAAGLAGFRAQMRMQLVPQLMALAEGPAALRAKYEGGNLARGVYRSSAGAAAYGQANPELAFTPNSLGAAFSGFGAGFAQGSGIGGSFGGGGGGGGSLLGGLFGGQQQTYGPGDNPQAYNRTRYFG